MENDNNIYNDYDDYDDYYDSLAVGEFDFEDYQAFY